jgi:hypothetical protein
MAIDRGTRKATFTHILEVCTILGTLGGAAYGVYQTLGETPFELLMSAIRVGFFGFLAGTAVGLVLGTLAVIVATIFGR